MLFDTGCAPKGIGIVEVDKIFKRHKYTAGKYHTGLEDEVIYMVFNNGDVSIAKKSLPKIYDKDIKEKEIINICSKL